MQIVPLTCIYMADLHMCLISCKIWAMFCVTHLQLAVGDGLTWHGDVDGMALPPACPGFIQQP